MRDKENRRMTCTLLNFNKEMKLWNPNVVTPRISCTRREDIFKA